MAFGSHSEAEGKAAIARVSAGSKDTSDIELASEWENVTGSVGDSARAALTKHRN